MARQTYAQRQAASLRRYGQTLYERRIEASERQGRTRQFARGHGYRLPGGPSEYGRRVERAVAAGRLTPSERAFARRQAPRMGLSEERAIAAFQRRPREERIETMRVQQALARRYGRRHSGRSIYDLVAEELGEFPDFEDFEDAWYWY